MALYIAGIQVEIAEVDLKEIPPSMLALSAKGTVPVLQLTDGQALDESLAIMDWALGQNDPENWLPEASSNAAARLSQELIAGNDGSFKQALDRYKYPQRYANEDCSNSRENGLVFLNKLNTQLATQPYLLGETLCYADIAIFPFVRQFANVDFEWFENSQLTGLQIWLDQRINSALFKTIMEKNRKRLFNH
jgi:glutathione S-transferase